MLFNSLQYFFFLLIVWLAWLRISFRHQWIFLLIASYVFYMMWNPFYLTLIVASTLNDYLVALGIERVRTQRRRWALLLVSLITNLGLLFIFKYWNFFNHSAATVASWLGLSWYVPDLSVLLPVGISFYTFQTLSYTIDVYRGHLPAEHHLGRFAVYVAFFPQLVAGPIERAARLLPQLARPKSLTWDRIQTAVMLILWGLFKKVVVADRLSIYVDAIYNNVPEHNGSSHLLATYAFAFQIYCDFSGYSDIAIGSARLFNVDLMTNFRSPYFARDMQEFWRRWHISLSTWLRDYLYIPLGGNRKGTARTYFNLMITMLLGGLWHGASWNFVIWGALHGIALAWSRLVGFRPRSTRNGVVIPALIDGIKMLVTFHFVCLTWVFFRAGTLQDAWTIIQGFGSFGKPMIDSVTMCQAALGVVAVLVVDAIANFHPNVWKDRIPHLSLGFAAFALLLFGIILLGTEQGAQFIYFQF